MQKKVKLLDCTLRDGGYINDWNFGHQTMLDSIKRLDRAGIDYVEIGFLDDRQSFDINRSIQPTTECYDRIYHQITNKRAFVTAMIDYGTCSADNISECKDSFIDGIRIIFKKPNMYKAIEFAGQIKAKGYAVFLQLVSITSYSDRELLDLIDLANELQPYAVSIVDTYGLMHKEKMLHYFDLLDVNLNENIAIGYHSHNNFQLAYSNSIELIKHGSNHQLLIDGTVFGMGKSAGNAPLELLVMFLNDNYGSNYDLNQILEIIDLTVSKIYREKPWGYSMPLFIAASSDCHPNYVNYLINKKSLSIKSINEILKNLTGDDKLNYNQKLIEALYKKYQTTILCDKNKELLLNEIENRDILLIGPGMSIHDRQDMISEFIDSKNVITISVNCFPDFKLDYFFVSNDKRYSMLSAVCDINHNTKIIATSNVCEISDEFDYILNYDNLVSDGELIGDNSLIMALKLLCSAKCGTVYLAGFDGFSRNNACNYYDEYLDFTVDVDRLLKVNDLIKEKLNEFGKKLSLEFLTKSYYECENDK